MTLSDRNESKSHIFSLRNWACPEDLAQQDSTAVIEAEELLAILPYIHTYVLDTIEWSIVSIGGVPSLIWPAQRCSKQSYAHPG